MFNKITVIVALLLCAGLAAGCGSDDEQVGNNNGIVGSNNGNNGTGNNGTTDGGPEDASDAGDVDTPDVSDAEDGQSDDGGGDDGGGGDAGDADGGDAAPQCDPACADDEACVEGSCIPATTEAKCAAATDLGTLSPGSPLTATGSLRNATNLLQTSCGNGGGVEQVFTFQVAEDSRIDFVTDWQGQFFAVTSFRRNQCVSTQQEALCTSGSDPLYALAGEQIYLVVEEAGGVAGDFEIQLAATAESCPAGLRKCDGDTLQICAGGGESNDFPCGTGCANGDCLGNSCQNPIEVTASTTFSGNLGGFDSTVNFENNQLCTLQDGTNITTSGPDIYFKLPGLTAGQTVAIDTQTSDSNNNAVFITTNCTSPISCERVQLTPEEFDWEVPADGDYFIIVDALNLGSSAYQYSFDIQPAP